MIARLLIGFCLLLILAFGVSLPSTAQDKDKDKKEDKPKSEKFSALAYMPHGAGPAMVGAGARVNVDIWVNSYTSDADAKTLATALLEGGSDNLLKALEKKDTIGKIRLNGRAGFYDFKLIRSHEAQGGRRIYLVGDRPVGFLEMYVGNRSQDYPFGIMQLDLKKNSKGREEGTGALLYAAKIKVLENNRIELESYGIDAIRMLGVRKF
ncbi:MAG TPA: hypothetical protein VFR51_08185 [Pyrinomonadaceae bacterium]|nr:hypothetical protein [Pyrinomonadaceae bacterium]